MRQIQVSEVAALSKTHRWFFRNSVKGETEKAFLVRMQNNTGGNAEFWLPKSRLLFQVIPDPNPGREGQTMTKFFVPKFFTK